MKQSKWKAFRQIFQMAPSSFAEMILWNILSCVLSVCTVWATGHIAALLIGGYSKEMLGTVLLYGILLVLSAAHSIYFTRYRVQFQLIIDFEQKIRAKLFKKSSKISNEAYEDASAATMIRLADGAKQNLFRYVEIWISIVSAVVQALLVTLYVSSFDAWFLLLLPFSVIPPCLNLLYQAKLWKRYYAAVEQCKKEESEYIKGLIDEAACKESRMTYASDLLFRKWHESRNQRDAMEQKKATKLLILQLLLVPIDFIGAFDGYMVAVILLFCEKIDYAACAAAITAYASIVSALSSLVSSIGYEGQYHKMIQPFFDYLSIGERPSSEMPVPFRRKIQLDHVSFRYPKQHSDALSDINLTIKKGEVIAIVGENGAGKTTLTNLILGLFLPSSGTILYDDQDISACSENTLHQAQSVVSQTFARYKMTVRDNIAIGDFSHADDMKIEQMRSSFLTDAQLSPDTMLGKEFGGRDLSGGQWQQLSCARGFYKDSDFLVLDEATSAIDPLKEKAMIDAFRRELQGKTGILVTHRLGAVSLADRIIVLEHGHIVQQGTHRELLAQGGTYGKLWNAQTKAFGEA